MQELSGYHIAHAGLSGDPVICKISKDGSRMTHKQYISHSETLQFIIEHLQSYDNNTIEVTVDGKPKYIITLKECE